jgi:hypothetical protein
MEENRLFFAHIHLDQFHCLSKIIKDYKKKKQLYRLITKILKWY